MLMSLGLIYTSPCHTTKLHKQFSPWILAAFGNIHVFLFSPISFSRPHPLQGSFPAVPLGSSFMGKFLLWASSWLYFYYLHEVAAFVPFICYPSCIALGFSLWIVDFTFLVCTHRLSPGSDIYVTVSSMALARSQPCRNSPSNLSSSSETGSGGGTYRQKSMPEG